MLEDLPILLLRFFVLTIALTFHEAAHAWVAWRLGDDTAKRMGRLSLNPLVHMDPLGSLMILGRMPIGWAKPVPVDPRNMRNPRTGMPLVAFAGPMSNLIMAVLACMVYFGIGHLIYGTGWYKMLILFIQFNFSLAIFNLMPIMPLDGSKIVTAFMSDRFADRYEATMERIGVFPLIAIVAFEAIGNGPGIISYWFHFWKPLIGPVLAIFRVPGYVYPF